MAVEKTLKEQKCSWSYSKGWDKGGTAPLLEERAGQQCGWVGRSELLALPSPGTWESKMTLLTVYHPSFSVNLNLIRAKQNGETLWHQLSAEEWLSEKWIWSSYCHLTHSLMYDLVFCWSFPPFILLLFIQNILYCSSLWRKGQAKDQYFNI